MLREVICARLRWRRLSAAADVTCPIAPHRLEEIFVQLFRNNLRPSCVKKTCPTFSPFDSLIAKVSVPALKSPRELAVSAACWNCALDQLSKIARSSVNEPP